MLPSARNQLPARETEAERRKKREQDLVLLVAFLAGSLDRQAIRFIRGETTQQTFLYSAMALLKQAHYKAAVLGSLIATGDYFGINTVGLAERTSASQRNFLYGFLADMEMGRYAPQSEGGAGARARKARFELYGLRCIGTANEAWLMVQRARGMEVLWVLDPRESHHCQGRESCPAEAKKGWLPASKRRKVPCGGDTPCLGNCRCHMVTRDGQRSFSNA